MKTATILSLAVCSRLTTAKKLPLSFAGPLQDFIPKTGERHVPGWSTIGDVKVAISGLKLTADSVEQRGELWTTTEQKTGLHNEASMAVDFRMSGKGDMSEVGGSLTFFFVDAEKPIPTRTMHYNHLTSFSGVAVSIDRDPQPSASQGGNPLYNRVRVLSGDGRSEGKVIGSCGANFQYDENRDDFLPSHSSSIRMFLNEGSIRVEIDATSGGTWAPCVNIEKRSGLLLAQIPGASGRRLGIVALTEDKKNHFEVSRVTIHDNIEEGMSHSAIPIPKESSKSMHILHVLEHELFQIHTHLERSLQVLENRMYMEWHHMDILHDKLTHMLTGSLEHRIESIEQNLILHVSPWIDSFSEKFDFRAKKLLEDGINEATGGYISLKQIFIFLCLVAIVVHYQQKELKTLKRSNSVFGM